MGDAVEGDAMNERCLPVFYGCRCYVPTTHAQTGQVARDLMSLDGYLVAVVVGISAGISLDDIFVAASLTF